MGNVTAKTSGEIATFMSPSMTNIKSLKVHFSPKQLGTGDPSPENVREIVGWDGVEVNGCGKNLINLNTIKQKYRVNIQGEVVPAATYCLTDYIPVFSSSKYYLSNAGTLAVNACTAFYDKNKELLNTTRNITPIITPDNCAYIRCSFKIENTDIVQLELGSTATLYEPYQGNNISYQWELPDEYQEVEYIESTGTQHIDTLINLLSNDFKIECKFELLSNKNVEQPLFSIWTSTYQYWNCFVRQNNYNNAIDVYTGSHHSFGSVALNDVKSVFLQRISNTWSLTYDGTNIEWNYTPTKINDITLKLFKRGDLNSSSSIRIYNFKLDINNIESLNLIPCYRKSDNEIGMYDTVSQTFYTNQGTGTFLKGDDVDKTFYGGYIDLINGELVEDMRYKQITSDELSNAGDYIGYTSSVTALDGQSAVWIRNLFNSTARGRKSGGIKANCNAFKVLMNSTGVSSSQNRTAFAVDGESITSVADFISTVETLEQNGNGLYLAYELATPITHQLTPTQLKSFVGQNNFWSNADYVEVEYDLIETIDIQKAKQKIIMNQPHVETLTGGNRLLFNSDIKSKMKQCKVSFLPQQEGSGAPSPTNIRTITGWVGLDIYCNDTKYDVDWTNDAGTIYGGYMDFINGKLFAEYFGFIADGVNVAVDKGHIKNSCYGGLISMDNYNFPDGDRIITNVYCNCFNPSNTQSINQLCIMEDDIFYISFYPFSKTSEDTKTVSEAVAETNAWLQQHPITVVYKLAEPIIYSFIPQQMTILKNVNTFYTNPKNNIGIKSWTLKSLIPTTDYLSNVTWVEHAYISASGKMTSQGTSASHYNTDPILLEAGTYNLKGFSYYNGTDTTRFRIHRYYNSKDVWVEQITFDTIDNLSPVDMTFTLADAGRIRLSIAMDFNGTLTKVS